MFFLSILFSLLLITWVVTLSWVFSNPMQAVLCILNYIPKSYNLPEQSPRAYNIITNKSLQYKKNREEKLSLYGRNSTVTLNLGCDIISIQSYSHKVLSIADLFRCWIWNTTFVYILWTFSSYQYVNWILTHSNHNFEDNTTKVGTNYEENWDSFVNLFCEVKMNVNSWLWIIDVSTNSACVGFSCHHQVEVWSAYDVRLYPQTQRNYNSNLL